MNIDELKTEYKKIRVPQMDLSIDNAGILEDLVQRIKQQDKDDEKYILHNEMIPVFIGLFFLTIIMLFTSVNSILQFLGILLCYSGLISTLILMSTDYKNISKEPYDLSLLGYLQQKEERLKSWRRTPAKYRLTVTILISGVIILIVGSLNISGKSSVFIFVYLVLWFVCWIIGEYFYRKRHREKHQPLLRLISKLKDELCHK